MRHGTEAQQAAHISKMVAGRHAWLAAMQAAGLPMPCGRKRGAKVYTPKTIQYLLRRFPCSLGWRLKAAREGSLPCQYALIEGADDLLLWAAPNSEALQLLEAQQPVSQNCLRQRRWRERQKAKRLEAKALET